jgi:hypothetical protein
MSSPASYTSASLGRSFPAQDQNACSRVVNRESSSRHPQGSAPLSISAAIVETPVELARMLRLLLRPQNSGSRCSSWEPHFSAPHSVRPQQMGRAAFRAAFVPRWPTT